MALLGYVLLRYLSYASKWAHGFTRLFTIVRAVLWSKLDLLDLLGRHGTAQISFRNRARPDQAYLPGFLCGVPNTGTLNRPRRCFPEIPDRNRCWKNNPAIIETLTKAIRVVKDDKDWQTTLTTRLGGGSIAIDGSPTAN